LATVTGEIGLTCWCQVNQRSASAATVRVRLPRCSPRVDLLQQPGLDRLGRPLGRLGLPLEPGG
jgi:hypothetical protein